MRSAEASDTAPVARTQHKLGAVVEFYLRDPRTGVLGGDELNSQARPVVLDANRLRGELRRLARSKQDTALVTLAQVDFLRLFAAPHVLQEVEKYIEAWAVQTGTPIEAYLHAWRTKLRPLITEVSFSAEMLTPDERLRIDKLSQPAPLGDPDDVPTVIAAMILAAPLLSADRKPMIAAYGPEVDLAAHDRYVDALFAGGQLYALSQWGRSSFTATYLVGAASVSGARFLASRLGPLPLALGGVSFGLWALSIIDSHRWIKMQAAASALREGILEVGVFYARAHTAYQRLEAPLVHDLDELPRAIQSARDDAREAALARAAQARVSTCTPHAPGSRPGSGAGLA